MSGLQIAVELSPFSANIIIMANINSCYNGIGKKTKNLCIAIVAFNVHF